MPVITEAGMSRSMSPIRRERETHSSNVRKTPLTVRVRSAFKGLPLAASTMISSNCPPSRAGSGIAFMSPKFSEISAANVSNAPCLPASLPICITPTGPARLPAFAPKLEKSLIKPEAVAEKSFPNSLFVISTAFNGPSGKTTFTLATFVDSRTPITPSPLTPLSGTTFTSSNSSGLSPARCTIKWSVRPFESFTAFTTVLVASSPESTSLPST
mmetsp:Transcript_67484/g.109441  ORF Transcript_67484/g.109441 Transcript_67484/m.109441 type:complete len:214 (-) Transcript_67484:939-1580(-)